jgi:predicted kinase
MLFEMTHFERPWQIDSFAQSDEVLVKHVEAKIIQHYLELGKQLLIDNSSITIRSRSAYLQTARRFKKSIGLIMIATPVQKCLERNKNRTNAVPESLISRLYSNLQVPGKSEGFDKLALIKDY